MISKLRILLLPIIAVLVSHIALAETYKADTRLNLRESPSTSAQVVGVLDVDDIVEVEEISDGWARIEDAGGNSVYASAKYLSVCEAAAEQSHGLNSSFSFSNKWVTPFLDGAGKNNLLAWIAIIVLIVTVVIMKLRRRSMDTWPLIGIWFLSMASIVAAFYFQDFGIDNFVVYVLIMIPLVYVCWQEYLSYMMIMKDIYDDDDEGRKFTECSFLISGIIGSITGVCAVWDWNMHSYVVTGIYLAMIWTVIRYFTCANNADCIKESVYKLPVVIAANVIIYIVGAIVFAIAIPLIITIVVIMAGGSSGSKSGSSSGRSYVHLSDGTVIDNTESMDFGYDQNGRPWHRKDPWSDEWIQGSR